MAIRQVLTYPDPILKEVSKPVAKVDKEIKKLLDDLLETAEAYDGVGVAAPQVGVLLRVIIMDIAKENEDGTIDRKLYKFVNPVITEKSDIIDYDEGCLSLPEFRAKTRRFSKITIEGLDENGRPQVLKLSGLAAIASQHEIDHLDGILLVDKVSLLKREMYRKKRLKILKEAGKR